MLQELLSEHTNIADSCALTSKDLLAIAVICSIPCNSQRPDEDPQCQMSPFHPHFLCIHHQPLHIFDLDYLVL